MFLHSGGEGDYPNQIQHPENIPHPLQTAGYFSNRNGPANNISIPNILIPAISNDCNIPAIPISSANSRNGTNSNFNNPTIYLK